MIKHVKNIVIISSLSFRGEKKSDRLECHPRLKDGTMNNNEIRTQDFNLMTLILLC